MGLDSKDKVIILEKSDPDILAHEINKRLKDGYSLYGNMTSAMAISSSGSIYYRYCQMMILND